MKQFESAPSNLKNLIILSLCQALFFSGRTLTFFAAALVAIAMLGEDLRFATAPVTAMLVGTSVATLPASFLMRAWGRRWGFTLGSLIGFSGALIAAQAVAMGNFAIFNFGIFLSGLYGGFAQQYRFAAAEVAPVPGRSRLKSKPIGVGACALEQNLELDHSRAQRTDLGASVRGVPCVPGCRTVALLDRRRTSSARREGENGESRPDTHSARGPRAARPRTTPGPPRRRASKSMKAREGTRRRTENQAKSKPKTAASRRSI